MKRRSFIKGLVGLAAVPIVAKANIESMGNEYTINGVDLRNVNPKTIKQLIRAMNAHTNYGGQFATKSFDLENEEKDFITYGFQSADTPENREKHIKSIWTTFRQFLWSGKELYGDEAQTLYWRQSPEFEISDTPIFPFGVKIDNPVMIRTRFRLEPYHTKKYAFAKP